MKIDFNNVRVQACNSYDRLVSILNSSIHKNEDYIEMPNGRVECIAGHVIVDASDIKEALNDLRMTIGSIAMTFDPDSEDFKDVYPKDRSLAVFNEDSE